MATNNKRFRHRLAVLTQLSVLAVAQEALVHEPPLRVNSEFMLGDWDGRRTALAKKGVTFQLLYVDDLLSDSPQNLFNWSRVRSTIDVDFGKAGLAAGLKFHITAMWQAGSNLGSRIGAIANPSSLASINLVRLDSFWFEKAIAGNRVHIRAGQFAGLDYYGLQPYGDSFINLPLGYAMSNLITSTYETFAPAATPAFEVRYAPSVRFYVKSAIFSGNRNPFHDDENGLHFKFKDAPVIGAEAGYVMGPETSPSSKSYRGAYAVGATINTGPFSNVATGQRSRTNYLLYFTGNQQVFRSQTRPERTIDTAFACDWSPADVARIFSQITGGVRFHGWVPRRARDTASAAIVSSHTSGVLNRSLRQTGRDPLRAEKLLEFNYAISVNRWLTLQPVVEHYFNLGGDARGRGRTVIGFRTLFVL